MFESLIEKVTDVSCYNFTNMRVQRYLDEQVLKTTSVIQLLENQLGLKKTQYYYYDVNVYAKDTKTVGKVV